MSTKTNPYGAEPRKITAWYNDRSWAWEVQFDDRKDAGGLTSSPGLAWCAATKAITERDPEIPPEAFAWPPPALEWRPVPKECPPDGTYVLGENDGLDHDLIYVLDGRYETQNQPGFASWTRHVFENGDQILGPLPEKPPKPPAPKEPRR